MTTSALRRGAATAALLCFAVTITGCAGTSDSSDSAGGDEAAGSVSSDRAEAPVPSGARAYSANLADQDQGAFGALDSASSNDEAAPAEEAEAPEQALISSGNVALRSDDVGETRFEVQKVVNEFRGEVAKEDTATDDDGAIRRSALVLRIPSAEFARSMKALEKSGDLITSSTNVADVTTKVIDTGIRVKVQRGSIRRITLLLDRAQSIPDIVRIEGELSRRQADLGSLLRQKSYLEDQTEMATITVTLERTKDAKKKKEPEAAGFAAGLDQGWTQMKEMAVDLATAGGATLPFAILLLLVAIPGYPLLRRFVRRSAAPEPQPAEA
ncbi:MAG: DUF4349 domain-containing protein [Nocardioides sp.]